MKSLKPKLATANEKSRSQFIGEITDLLKEEFDLGKFKVPTRLRLKIAGRITDEIILKK